MRLKAFSGEQGIKNRAVLDIRGFFNHPVFGWIRIVTGKIIFSLYFTFFVISTFRVMNHAKC